MIQLKNICKFYNSENSIGIGLHNVSLSFSIGEFVAIVGTSGSGKTTLLNVISGMDTYEEGELIIEGKSMNDFTKEQIEEYRRANVAFIFQNYQLIDSYTVLENVMIELIFKGFNRKEAKEQAIEILNKVGMGKRLKNRASKLSGGEKQRVVIARALASDAKILICDEPTGNLDSKNSIEIMKLLKENSSDKLVLFVTHDESLIEGNANRIVKIKDGKVDEDRKLEEVEEKSFELLESKPNDFKIQAYVAMKNVLRTPKKTIFTLTVFLILAVVIIFSTAYIPLDIMAASSTSVSYNMFPNDDPNRIVVYEDNGFDGKYDLDAIKIEHDYLLDEKYQIGVIGGGLNTLFKKPSAITVFSEGITPVVGRLPEAKDEILVLVDSTIGQDYLSSNLNRSARIGLYSKYFLHSVYKIVGFAYNNPNVDTFDDDVIGTDVLLTLEGYNALFDEIDSTIFGNVPTSAYLTDFSAKCNGKTLGVNYSETYNREDVDEEGNLKKNIIYVSHEYINQELEFYLGKYKLDLSEFEIVYDYFLSDQYVIKMSQYVAYNIIKETPYRTSFYVSSETLDEVKLELMENEHLTVFAIKDATKTIYRYSLESVLEKAFYFAFFFAEIVVSLFVSSLITSFILGTKKKDFGILRVIGLSEKDVLKVLNIELLIVMVLAIIFDISVCAIINFLKPDLGLGFIFESVWKLIFSIIVLLIMALILSFKWNKKMFNKTAREVLKVGDSL